MAKQYHLRATLFRALYISGRLLIITAHISIKPNHEVNRIIVSVYGLTHYIS